MRKKNKTKQSFSDCIPPILLMKLARNRRQEKGEKVFHERYQNKHTDINTQNSWQFSPYLGEGQPKVMSLSH